MQRSSVPYLSQAGSGHALGTRPLMTTWGTGLCLKEVCQQLYTWPSFEERTSGSWSSLCAILFASYKPRSWKTGLKACA
ncbi:hypothetical protein DPMN_022103 [Dreissena polymorpha]|uniref:Uncharacterized protein n=1 Tax=Dreissena polymorpha TaxID=45954 RepID=A0A9D4NJR3_DREPO|nr:hypothetical protein DPMN_022103 [Dreissena polymorpha]